MSNTVKTAALVAIRLCATHGDPTGGELGFALAAVMWAPDGRTRHGAGRRLGRLVDQAIRSAPADARAAWVDLGWDVP